MFNNLFKAVVGVVTLPVDLVADVVTMGGLLTDRPGTYTAKKASDIVKNIARATDANG